MDLKEAMYARHTVRKYKEDNLRSDVVNLLNEKVEAINKENDLSIKLMVNETHSIMGIAKVLMTKNVKNYFIMAGDDIEKTCESLGYYGAYLMLLSQTLGLNTWWVGGMFNRSVSKYVDNKKVIGIIAVGYGEDQGVQHKMGKTFDDVVEKDSETTEWFKQGVKAALYAPTAMNAQDFKFSLKGNKVKAEGKKGSFGETDLGIAKYHFELGAGKENFEWE